MVVAFLKGQIVPIIVDHWPLYGVLFGLVYQVIDATEKQCFPGRNSTKVPGGVDEC